MLYKLTLPLGVLLLFTGCASDVPSSLTQVELSQLKGKTVLITKRMTPDFTAMTASDAMEPPMALDNITPMDRDIGGEDIALQFGIKNPAEEIAGILLDDLSLNYGMKTVNSAPVMVDGDSVKTILKNPIDAQYLLDVQTNYWGFTYFPVRWPNYVIHYQATLRFFDVKGKKLIAEDSCDLNPTIEITANSGVFYGELLADNASKLKYQLDLAAENCIDKFQSTVFKL